MNNKIINELIGIPFNKNGNSPKEGFNCWSFVKYVYKNYYSIEIPDYESYFANPLDKETYKHFLKHKQESIWKKISIPVEPCVILIRNNSKYVNHAGIYIGNNKFLHCLLKTGVIISDIYEPNWRLKIEGFYKYEGK
jgi:cell wall-associated NlpC family hydrolase